MPLLENGTSNLIFLAEKTVFEDCWFRRFVPSSHGLFRSHFQLPDVVPHLAISAESILHTPFNIADPMSIFFNCRDLKSGLHSRTAGISVS